METVNITNQDIYKKLKSIGFSKEYINECKLKDEKEKLRSRSYYCFKKLKKNKLFNFNNTIGCDYFTLKKQGKNITYKNRGLTIWKQ